MFYCDKRYYCPASIFCTYSLNKYNWKRGCSCNCVSQFIALHRCQFSTPCAKFDVLGGIKISKRGIERLLFQYHHPPEVFGQSQVGIVKLCPALLFSILLSTDSLFLLGACPNHLNKSQLCPLPQNISQVLVNILSEKVKT